MPDEEDEWSATSRDLDHTSNRRMLIFSDSRQDAAYFATYLQESYDRILRRRLIVTTLEKYKEQVLKNHWRISDLVEFLKSYLRSKSFEYEHAADRSGSMEMGFTRVYGSRYNLRVRRLWIAGFLPVLPSNWKPPGLYAMRIEFNSR